MCSLQIISNALTDQNLKEDTYVRLCSQGEELSKRLSSNVSINSAEHSNIAVEHPNIQNYSMLLHAYAKQGLTDEAQPPLFDKMTDIPNHVQQHCRSYVYSYKIIRSLYTSTHEHQKEHIIKERQRILSMIC